MSERIPQTPDGIRVDVTTLRFGFSSLSQEGREACAAWWVDRLIGHEDKREAFHDALLSIMETIEYNQLSIGNRQPHEGLLDAARAAEIPCWRDDLVLPPNTKMNVWFRDPQTPNDICVTVTTHRYAAADKVETVWQEPLPPRSE
jgi:hypothetical protein